MKSIVFVFFAVALSVNLRDSFSAFESKFGKNYLASEKAFRAKVFEYNMEWAHKQNALGHRWTVGMTPFADLTDTEFINSKLCGCVLVPQVLKPAVILSTSNLESIDWREKGAVTPVKNQASCGSCWAFSAVGALEGRNYIANGKLITLSEQQLVDCDTSSRGCNGGINIFALGYSMENGLCTEEDYPYHAKDEDCKANKCKEAIRNKSYERLPGRDGNALKAAISMGPVSACLDAHSPIFKLYTGGVIDSDDCGTSITHAVVIVGYKEDYMIIKNSWGVKWGEKGYIKIKWVPEGLGICGINQQNSYPIF